MSETIYHFDHTLSTEERFGVRKWLQSVLTALNGCNQAEIAEYLNPSFTCTGFTNTKLNKVAFTLSMSSKERIAKKRICNFSELTITCIDGTITARGNYHETLNKELVLEGKIMLKISKHAKIFKLGSISFYPRLKVEK